MPAYSICSVGRCIGNAVRVGLCLRHANALRRAHSAPSTTATLILFFGAKTSTFAAYQTTIGGQEPSTNVKVSL